MLLNVEDERICAYGIDRSQYLLKEANQRKSGLRMTRIGIIIIGKFSTYNASDYKSTMCLLVIDREKIDIQVDACRETSSAVPYDKMSCVTTGTLQVDDVIRLKQQQNNRFPACNNEMFWTYEPNKINSSVFNTSITPVDIQRAT
ncbi:hypothetical protein CHS0354_005734 [Potamilus streckersoni]|uniref:Uncharacterized protein n=1 Tax=Potamilus streckersoni TaxID=2493646 RepID=A0AAE0VKA2_9BIVA|nr:hypothetical protein CHS0354_005734 [Potamilus streckersoni]